MAIFSQTKVKTVNKVVELEIEKIIPNPHQPRFHFDNDELVNLSESIRIDGLIQPLTVRKNGEIYELVSGERRLRAAKLAGLNVIPCIIMEMTERTSALLALVENIQRSDLSFFEEAFAIANLIELYGMTQEDAAIRLGMAQSTLANKLRLLKHSEIDKRKISDYGLTERHARALLKIGDPEKRSETIDKIAKLQLNVEQTEKYIEKMFVKEKELADFKKRAILFKDVRLFSNTINRAVETVKMAGIQAAMKKVENEKYIEYYIKIPRN